MCRENLITNTVKNIQRLRKGAYFISNTEKDSSWKVIPDSQKEITVVILLKIQNKVLNMYQKKQNRFLSILFYKS